MECQYTVFISTERHLSECYSSRRNSDYFTLLSVILLSNSIKCHFDNCHSAIILLADILQSEFHSVVILKVFILPSKSMMFYSAVILLTGILKTVIPMTSSLIVTIRLSIIPLSFTFLIVIALEMY